ncbi:MAG TPA: hypothetical protein VFL29_03700 [Candidatus Dormibacteraeota bacterium]|nr:hypothetical protein [Candidatus Dormibacteraeota bacterium]
MSPYLLAGPAVALIGIVAVMFVMRHKSTEKRSMYSSRRSQIQRKVAAARSRTLAPHGRSSKTQTQADIAAQMAPATPAYEAPVAPRQAWEVGPATSAPAYAPPPAAPPAYEPPPAEPPTPFTPSPTFAPAPAAPAPSTPPLEEPSWTPAPAEPAWTPGATPVPAPVEPVAAPEPVSTPAGAGASWSIVGQDEVPATEERAPKAKDKKKDKQAAATATGGAWSLASGDSPSEEGGDEVAVKAPNPAMAIAQYAVLVVGLVMVLIGVLVMVANSKVT